MKKRLLSGVTVLAMLMSMLPVTTAAARSGFAFMNDVSYELPIVSKGEFIDADVDVPSVRSDGFLIEPTAPLKQLPAEGKLLAEVGEPDETATPIGTVEELAAMTSGGNYVLTADIDLTGVEWTPISGETFTLDGQGHTISGLSPNTTENSYVGLFGQVQNLTVRNAAIAGDFAATTYCGILAGSVTGTLTLENCSFSGGITNATLKSFGSIGGAVAQCKTAVMTDCVTQVDITAAVYAPNIYQKGGQKIGGLVGHVYGAFKAVDCLSDATVAMECTLLDAAFVGGLVGYLAGNTQAEFLRCENRGALAGSATGGLAGYAEDKVSLRLEDCSAAGAVTGIAYSYTGTTINDVTDYPATAGGLVGRGSGEAINCKSSGNVTDTDDAIDVDDILGGLVGNGSVSFEDCVIAGKFTLHQATVGGLLGSGEGTFQGCYADVEFSSSHSLNVVTNIGGLCGAVTGATTIQNCYAIMQSDMTKKESTLLNVEHSSVGGLVGTSAGQLTMVNCAAEVDEETEYGYLGNFADGCDHWGGLIGAAISGDCTVLHSYAVGKINANAQDNGCHGHLGGLIGYIESSNTTVGQCWADVDLDGGSTMGGLIGGDFTDTYSYVTQITMYGSWASGEISALDGKGHPPNEWESYSDYSGGLIGYAGRVVMQDCCFLGSFTDANAELNGGLIGAMRGGLSTSPSSIMRNCYAVADLIRITNTDQYTVGTTGGLIGHSAYLNIEDCWYRGRIGGTVGTAGGIVGVGAAGNTGAVMRNCRTEGSICAGVAGGIAGSWTGEMYSCTSNMDMNLPETTAYAHGFGNFLGGIAAMFTGGPMVDCHMLQPIVITLENTPAVVVGGLVAIVTDARLVKDCSSKGVSVRHGNLTPGGIHGAEKYLLTVGGLVATEDNSAWFFDDDEAIAVVDCRVDGSVTAHTTTDYYKANSGLDYECTLRMDVGGIYGQGRVQASGCTVNGSVWGSLSCSHEMTFGTVYVGGLLGRSTLYEGGCTVAGSVAGSADYVHRDYLFLGGGILYQGTSPEIVLPQRDPEDYQVKVLALDAQTLSSTPVKGASVTVDGISVGTTDDLGLVNFRSDVVSSSGLVTIAADCEGYFHRETVTYLADGGSTTLVLEKKVPGEIYVKSAYYMKNGTFSEVLSGHNLVRVPMLETGHAFVSIGVDWNDIDEANRTICLVGETGQSVIYLQGDGTGYANFADMFEAGEAIYAVAKGTYNGEEVVTKQKIYVEVKAVDVSIPTPAGEQDVGGDEVPGDKDSNTFLYFLNGLNIKLDLGELEKYSSNISYKNGVLKLKFGATDKNKQSMSVWSGLSEKVAVEGEIAIPLTDVYGGDWSGKITASINDGYKYDHSNTAAKKYNETVPDEKKITYNFAIGAVPCFIETSLSVGGSAAIGVHGPYDAVYVNGDITVKGKAGVHGGVGGSIADQFEVKFGPYGDLTATIPMKMDQAKEPSFDLDPKISGGLGAKASVKAAIFEIEAELKLGGFDWDKHGLVWSLLDKKYDSDGNLIGGESEDAGEGAEIAGTVEGKSLSADGTSSGWSMMTRDYLASGGGFQAQDASGWSFDSGAGSNLRYENISPTSEAVMSAENGQLVLYFTADDGTASGSNVADHTVLYRTVMQDDGWSTPEAITSAEDGYPALPDAESGFVTWVNSDETADLDAMLASTDIKVFDGTTVTTFEGNGYVYNPKISVSYDRSKAMLCWLSDSAVTSENLLGGDAVLYYANYSNGVWGEVKKMVTVGIPVQAEPYAASNLIFYQNTIGRFFKSSSTSAVHANCTARTGIYENLTASMSEDGKLTVYRNSEKQMEMKTNWCGTQAPVVAWGGYDADYNNRGYYIFWPEADGIRYVNGYSDEWGSELLLTGTDSAPMGIQAAVVDGTPVVSYYQTVATSNGERTDLYTVTVDPAGVDLVLAELDYNSEEMVNNGCVTLQAVVFNNGLADVEAVAVTVTDEEGSEVYNHTIEQTAASGEVVYLYPMFAADGKAHTYTMSVLPVVGGETVDDVDRLDNVLELEAGRMAAEIVDTSFLSEDGEDICLQAMVRNSGGVELDDLTVEIGTSAGDVLLTQGYLGEENAIPIGSYRQIMLENVQANTCYTVTVRSGDEVLDTDMLIYEDPNAAMLQVKNVTVAASGEAELTLVGQNLSVGSAQVVLALYQDGRMVSSGMTKISDLDGTHDLSFNLSDELLAGSYSYKIFFLSEDDSLTPVWHPVAGMVRIY